MSAEGKPDGPGEFPRLEFTDDEGNARLRALTGGEAGFLAKLLKAFLADMREKLTALRKDLDRGDGDSAGRRAAGMRSSGAAVAAGGFADLCGRLERAIAGGSGAQDGLSLVEKELAGLEKGIRSLLRE